MRQHRRLRFALLALVVACDSNSVGDVGTGPQNTPIDTQLRQAIANFSVVPILPVAVQDPALVDLGRALFFDKILSGNRDVSCASCHNPVTHIGDGQSLAAGTGALVVNGMRRPGSGREFTPRNAPSLFSSSLGSVYMFWDGRLNQEFGPTVFRTPAGLTLPSGLSGLLAAQAMMPIINRVEMLGVPGDRDVLGNPNEMAQYSDSQNTAVWDAAMKRLLAVSAYLQKFNAAYPATPANQLGFQHAANAIAAFETETFTKTGSAFDRYLARDDNALSVDQKKGAVLFFGKARCASCHSGPLLGTQQFANGGVPQLGPGTGKATPLDAGREDIGSSTSGPLFFFRVPPLRNVELSAPYMHNGVYATLEEVVRHYNNVDSSLKAFDPTELDPSLRASYHGDAATIAKVRATMDGRLAPLGLSVEEQAQIVAFLKSLTDPSARDMNGVTPATVPSGLPVRN
jgi:cytochrome c peroxidase